jgi:2-methylisocitrate lyase-like PEP mutase family enzyme
MTSTETFRILHAGPDLLLLPNAWDAGSARLIESLGAKAIATTSAGLAWSRGFPDGDALPIDRLLDATREIARVIRVPLSMDIEGGYSDDPSAVARVVASIVDVGAAGINIEDGAAAPERLCGKVEAVRRTVGDELFINARTDVYLRGIASGEAAIAEVVRRASLYRAAGCDGLFAPGLAAASDIRAVARAIHPMPLNVMLVPDLPPADTLRTLGVRRLSAGAAIAQAALACTSRLASRFLAGAMDEIFAAAVEYGATNRLFQPRERPASR